MKLAFDFHLHSCLSPCGHMDMTPANLAAMCALAGYQAVALTDHNTVGNCAAFCQAAQSHGLIALPGMELTCCEEVHVICLFPDLSCATAFGEVVTAHLPPIPNQPAFWGHQVYMDAQDHPLGEEPLLLAGATTLSVYEVPSLVKQHGGICYPAHIDRSSFSLLSNLGLWDPAMGFSMAELSLSCPPQLLTRPDLAGVRFVRGCDAHALDQIPDPMQWLSTSSHTPQHLLTLL